MSDPQATRDRAAHEPGLDIKPSVVDGSPLHRAFCVCGWRSAGWYADPDKAVARWTAHDKEAVR